MGFSSSKMQSFGIAICISSELLSTSNSIKQIIFFNMVHIHALGRAKTSNLHVSEIWQARTSCTHGPYGREMCWMISSIVRKLDSKCGIFKKAGKFAKHLDVEYCHISTHVAYLQYSANNEVVHNWYFILYCLINITSIHCIHVRRPCSNLFMLGKILYMQYFISSRNDFKKGVC